jgi:hypothetical protein
MDWFVMLSEDLLHMQSASTQKSTFNLRNRSFIDSHTSSCKLAFLRLLYVSFFALHQCMHIFNAQYQRSVLVNLLKLKLGSSVKAHLMPLLAGGRVS